LQRIAVAYDGSVESRHALQTAIALAEHAGASLTLIHVIKPAATGYGLAVQTIEEGDTERAEGNRILGEARELVPDGLPAEGRLLHGPPADVLAEVTVGFDLLVLGSRGHGSLMGTALGSVSGPLVRQAPCPVLVIPRGGTERTFAAMAPTAARRSG
jgi:nucleotide-binding universal stress UspA family protein